MNRYRQAGFTLLELVLVIGIIAVMAITELQNKKIDFEQMQARKLGMELFRYNNAVQRAIAKNSATPTFAGTYTGIDWLKASTCGGPAGNTVGYLPCSFLSHTGDETSVGRLSFSTEVSYSATDGMTAVTTMEKYVINGLTMGDLSGLAALVASGAYVVKDQVAPPVNEDGTVIYCLETPAPAVLALCGAAREQIVLYARNLAPGNTWLRTDHGNLMSHTIEYGASGAVPSSNAQLGLVDASMRQIRNVARIYNIDSEGGSNALILGNRIGAAARTTAQLLNNSVIIDADEEVLGELRVLSDINTEGDVFVNDTDGDGNGGNLTAQYNINSTEGDMTSEDGNLYALDGDNSGSDGNVEAQRDIISYQGDITAQDGDLYVEDANGDGNGGNIYVRGNGEVSGYITVGGDLEVDGESRLHGNAYIDGEAQVQGQFYAFQDAWFNENLYVQEDAFITGDITAKTFIDSDDSSFYVDPDGNSYFNTIDVSSTLRNTSAVGLNIDSDTINYRTKEGWSNTANPVKVNGIIDADNLRIKDRDGNYRAVSSFLSRYVFISAQAVNNGGSVPKPTCPDSGEPKIILNVQSALVSGEVPVDTGFDKMVADWYGIPEDTGATWTIRIGNTTRGALGGSGLAQIYCYYGS